MKKKHVLMVSFHFPPIASSSGFLRCLKFADYLDKSRFEVSVITASENAYELRNEHNKSMLHNRDFTHCPCFALDAARHLSIKGRYLESTALPDRWSSWVPFAVCRAIWRNVRHPIDVIWVTFPISSALVIGLALKKWFSKPLILDLRDPIWEEETWTGNRRQRMLKRLEEKILKAADLVMFTSPGTIEKYRRRYPQLIDAKARLLLNGYDEADFSDLQPAPRSENKLLLLHSGLLPRYERDPTAFFDALVSLRKADKIRPSMLECRLRGTGHDDEYEKQVKERGLEDMVTFCPPVPYRQALEEMMSADGLMVFQDHTCNWQIPAKVFEYMRIGKPILAWTDTDSDTAALLRQHTDTRCIAPLTDREAIAAAIVEFIDTRPTHCTTQNVEQFSREALTRTLESHLDHLVDCAPPTPMP